MKAEQARQLADQALARLIAAVEAGGSEALRAYLAAMARFHRYSFSNVMLIAMQRPDATCVAGFRRWKELGRYVRQGEKGIAIVAPMLVRRRREQSDGATATDGSHEQDAQRESLVRFKAVYVFDVAQTEGAPLPELHRVNGNPNGMTEKLKAFVASRGITLEYSDALGSADGVSRGGAVAIRPGLTPADEFAVLVHELAHEMLHRTERRTRTIKTIRETEAEAVAFVVCQAIGLDTHSACSDYIRLYNGDRETLTESLGLIQKTATDILDALGAEAATAGSDAEFAADAREPRDAA